jgi:hypothetical protein
MWQPLNVVFSCVTLEEGQLESVQADGSGKGGRQLWQDDSGS